MKLHPPITEAVGKFMLEVGADWDPATLQETDINSKFITYRAEVPRQGVVMELGGPPQIVTTAALAAAAMRLTVAETIALQDGREMLDIFMKQNPNAQLIRGGEPEQL